MKEHAPCPAESLGQCPVFEAEGECYEDTHHEYWPRSEYRTKVEREFRGLEVNQIEICRWLHNQIHAERRRSGKPSRKEMLNVIQEEKK